MWPLDQDCAFPNQRLYTTHARLDSRHCFLPTKSAEDAGMETTNQLLNVGFLGTGYIADWHAKALRSVRNARLVAVCDRDEPRVRAFASRTE